MPNINAHRADRSGVTQAEPYRIAVLTKEILKTDVVVNVAAVIEGDAAQFVAHKRQFHRNRETKFRIKNHKLIAAQRHADAAASGGVTGSSAYCHLPLCSCAIEREPAQRAAAAGKETLAERNVIAGKSRFQPDAQAVGPDNVVAAYVLVISCLPKEPAEVGVGAQHARVNRYVETFINSAMRIESVVAGVANERRGKRGESFVLIFGSDKLRDQQVGQAGAPKAIPQKDGLCFFCIEISLHLEAGFHEPCGKNRILAGAFAAYREVRTPDAVEEVRNAPTGRAVLVKPRHQAANAKSLTQATEVEPLVFQRKTRPPKCGLAGLEA